MARSTTPAPFGFTGEYRDSATGFSYLRARWYNPASGTLLGRDPFAGYTESPYSLHPYQYAYANPVSNTDPSGRQCQGTGCFPPTDPNREWIEDIRKEAFDICNITVPSDKAIGVKVTFTTARIDNPDAARLVAMAMRDAVNVYQGLTLTYKELTSVSDTSSGGITGGISGGDDTTKGNIGFESKFSLTVTGSKEQTNGSSQISNDLNPEFVSIIQNHAEELPKIGGEFRHLTFYLVEYDVYYYSDLSNSAESSREPLKHYKNVRAGIQSCPLTECSTYNTHIIGATTAEGAIIFASDSLDFPSSPRTQATSLQGERISRFFNTVFINAGPGLFPPPIIQRYTNF